MAQWDGKDSFYRLQPQFAMFDLLIDITFHFVYKRDAASLKMLTVDDMKSLFA